MRIEVMADIAFDTEENRLGTLVREQINSRNCFDFYYEPADGDLLTLKLTNSYNSFKYDSASKNWHSQICSFGSNDYLALNHDVIITDKAR